MGWIPAMSILSFLGYVTLASGIPITVNLPQGFTEEDLQQSYPDIGSFEGETESPPSPIEDVKLEHLGKLLATILLQKWPKGVSPLLYVERNAVESSMNVPPGWPEDQESYNPPFKRSRYYRKYPWKRQNSKYDAENRYLCQPTKEDVFRLLVALHEARQGSKGQMVNFCNRKRPASAVFTNIRFLG